MTLEKTTLDGLQRYIDDLALDEVSSLLEEARIEARAQVRRLLVDAIAERMLACAQEQVGGAPPPRVSAPGDAARGHRETRHDPDGEPQARARPSATREPATRKRATGELGWYVYGVVAEGYEPPRELAGIDDAHPVTVVPAEGIAAVASRVPLEEFGEDALTDQVNDLDWLETNARRHEHILERVREQTTLVPMRLCTIYHADSSVREMLAREHEFLLDALRRLESRTEWGVKLFASRSAAHEASPGDGDGVREADELREAGPGAAYMLEKRLRGKREAKAESALDDYCADVHARLTGLAVESKLNPLQPRELTNREERMLLNGVYLVDDRATRQFIGVADALRDEYRARGVELELTGPWPPYNFVNDGSEIGR